MLYVKRTDFNAEGQCKESVLAGTDMWSKETCDKIVVAFVLNHFVGCDAGASDLDSTTVSIIRYLQRGSKRKLGAARHSLARCELVTVSARLRKFDQHSERDLRLVIPNFEDELAAKNEELKRMKNNKVHRKKLSQDLSGMVEHTEKQSRVARQKICFRQGYILRTVLATRSVSSATMVTAATASITVTSDLGDSNVVRD